MYPKKWRFKILVIIFSSNSHGIDTSTPKEKTQKNEPIELQNEEDEDLMRATVSNQTRYFQDMIKLALGVQQVVKKFEKLNSIKNKQQTVIKK